MKHRVKQFVNTIIARRWLVRIWWGAQVLLQYSCNPPFVVMAAWSKFAYFYIISFLSGGLYCAYSAFPIVPKWVWLQWTAWNRRLLVGIQDSILEHTRGKFRGGVGTHLKQVVDISLTLVPWCTHPSLFVGSGLLGQARVCLKVFQAVRQASSSKHEAVIEEFIIQLQWKNTGLQTELANNHVYGSNFSVVALYSILKSFAVEEVGTDPAYTKGHNIKDIYRIIFTKGHNSKQWM